MVTASLRKRTAPLELGQNVEKCRSSRRLLEITSMQSRLLQSAAAAGLSNNLRAAAEHLGALHEAHTSAGASIAQAAAKANASWAAWHGLWNNAAVPRQRRSQTFQAVVQNRMSDGLKAALLTEATILRLHRAISKKIRYLLQGAAQACTNEWVRGRCEVPTVRAVLCCQRVRLLRSVLAMAGSFRAGGVRPAGLVDGSVSRYKQTAVDRRGWVARNSESMVA